MKRNLIIFGLFLLITVPSFAQSPGFRAAMDNGNKAYRAGDYNRALKEYKSAMNKPGADEQQAQNGIDKCLKAISERNKKQAAKAKELIEQRRKKGQEAMKNGKEAFDKGLWVEAKTQFELASDFDVAEAHEWEKRCQEEIIREQGFINVTAIEFAITTFYETITPFGNDLYASDFNEDSRLTMRIHYKTLDGKRHQIIPYFRIFDKDGQLITNDGNSDYTAIGLEQTISDGEHTMKCHAKCHFSPGEYTLHMLINEHVIYQTSISMLRKPGEALYFTVNGQSSINDVLDPSGGKVIYTLESDRTDPTLANVPNFTTQWCRIELSGNNLIVTYRPNHAGMTKTLSFDVVCGGIKVPIRLSQNDWNFVSNGEWTSYLQACVGEPQDKLHYHGEQESGSTPYFGIQYWRDKDMWFFGKLKNKRRIEGVYLSGNPRVYGIFQHTVFFAGTYNSPQMKEGACYDRFGNLLFKGPFKNDFPSPVSAYPQQTDYYPTDVDVNYRFDFVREDNGDHYLGETYLGKRNGYGIYFYSRGGYWVGLWQNGESVEGCYVDLDGTTSRTLYDAYIQ